MTRLSEPLQALIDAEQQAVGPTADAAGLCWDSIAADFQRGVLPELDVPPPTRPRSGAVWLALAILGAGVLAGGLHASDARSEVVSESISPPPLPTASAVVALPTEKRETNNTAFIAPLPETPAGIATPGEGPALKAAVVPLPEEPKAEPRAVPSPRPRPTRPVTAEPVDEDTFAAELRLLAQGHAALGRGEFSEALRIADLYHGTYPKGHFTEDRDALRVLALCSSGSGKASEAARRFHRAYPNSIHATRVRDVCDRVPASHEQPSTRSQP